MNEFEHAEHHEMKHSRDYKAGYSAYQQYIPDAQSSHLSED